MAIMEYCNDSDIRKKMSYDWNRFASSWKYDNREIILEILKLRDKKAKILGFNNYAELSIDSKMAESPNQVINLIWWISDKARKKWLLDLEEIKDYFNLNKIEAHDVAFYSRKLKEEKYSLDEKELKKYFEYEKVLDYLFNHVKNFYWIELKEISIDTYNKEVKVFEVIKDWNIISYYFIDPFYRKEKRSWAWANNLRSKELEKWFLPIILNVCNFLKSENWKNLISMRDAETLFHEFWHALHEMLSESKYSELSWFHVEWDFVELPSQINENWVSYKDSLKKLAINCDTWEYISNDLVEKLEKLKTFNSGIQTLRQNEFALLDMMLYSEGLPSNIDELDKKILDFVNNIWLFKRDEWYKMYCSFGHIFWWWYAAGYYSYMWAELLEADVFERIKEMWMFDRKTWEKFISTILGQGTKKPANELFKDFMWRELDNSAFMKRKWL
jgi:Zn-dependent oligopeptidase